MSPVLASPMVKVCLLVVPIVPAELRVKLPDMEAAPVVPKTWNLAQEVAMAPGLRDHQ